MTPEQQAELKQKNMIPGVVALVSGVLLILGSFLEWASVNVGDVNLSALISETSISGWTTVDGTVGDGPIFAVFGFIVAVMGALGLFGTTNLGTKIATIVFGVLAILVTLIEFLDIADTNNDLEGVGLSFGYGIGLFVLLFGSIGAIVAGILFKRKL